ncbi:methyltransferase, partial [Providencia stuartii]|uniref:methyltransferase n=1 Tax=Providencia stuartii TaxID=588 RepID=UPI0019545904
GLVSSIALAMGSGFGYALWCRSSTGLVLAVVLSLVYWVAARLIEEPFMYKLYAEEFRRRLE